jgi:Icc-related predicted phosphoesterase
MKITAISDLHGEFPELTGGDLLIIAGDCTSNDFAPAWIYFFTWLENASKQYRKTILIAGNHDNFLKSAATKKDRDDFIQKGYINHEFFDYLCDEAIEFEGLKIWGSPWSLWFPQINPHCMAFTGKESDLVQKYALIPHDVDILITHAPPALILDENSKGRSCGSYGLRHWIDIYKPPLVIFGHIHEQGGKHISLKHDLNSQSTTECYNVSIMDAYCEPTHKPTTIEI